MKIKSGIQIDERIIKIIKNVQWDIIFLLLSICLLILIKLLFSASMFPGSQSYSVKENADSDPNFSYNYLDSKHYPYEIKRDIFNFTVSPEPVSISKPQLQLTNEHMQEKYSPRLIYQGLITFGDRRIAALASNNKEYIAFEGDIIDNKYRLVKITTDSLLFYDMVEKKNIEVKKAANEQ